MAAGRSFPLSGNSSPNPASVGNEREQPCKDVSEAVLLQIPAKTLDAVAGFLEILGFRRIRNAKCRSESERRALHHSHTFGFEELGHKIFIARELLSRGCGLAHRAGARRIYIECTFRRRAFDAVGLVEHRYDEIAALLEDLVVLGDKILRTV